MRKQYSKSIATNSSIYCRVIYRRYYLISKKGEEIIDRRRPDEARLVSSPTVWEEEHVSVSAALIEREVILSLSQLFYLFFFVSYTPFFIIIILSHLASCVDEFLSASYVYLMDDSAETPG